MGEKKLIILVFRQRLGKVPQCPNLSTCQEATRERRKRRVLMCPWPSRSSSSRSEPPPATICTVVEVKREVWCMLTLCDTLQIRVKKNHYCRFSLYLHPVSTGPATAKGNHLKLTQPHSPYLMTRQRSRPPTVKCSAELEAEEAEKLAK